MCGIAGILSFNGFADYKNVAKMCDTLKHRGPDGEGIWVSEEKNVVLGHRRLAIIDLSDDGNQPMHYLNKRYTIVFNGEIYNYLELKKQLIDVGFSFISNSDTEVLLALYHFKKEKCLEDLDGMFAFAIWDNLENKLFCARDRFGEKPFYFTKHRSGFYFASEIKAFWSANIPKTLNEEILFCFLNFNLVRNENKPSNTFYKDIFMLEPGHYICIDRYGSTTITKYWDINLNEKLDIDFNQAKVTFLDLFTNSIKKRLRSDVPVGSSLSGGLDSSSISILIEKLKKEGQVQKTFSARFENFEKDEGVFMQMVVDKTNIDPYYTWPNENKFVEDFEKLCFHQDEPFGSASIFAQWEVMKLAKQQNVTVLLDGQGADEIAAGYQNYFKKYYGELFRTNKILLKNELQAYENFYGKKFNLTSSVKLQALFPEFTYNVKNSLVSKFIRRNKTLSSEFIDEYIGSKYPYNINYELNKDLKDSTIKYGLHELLRYADRNSMAFSREIRLPFLDHKIVEFLFSLPSEYKINGGITKFIFRKAFSGIVPIGILDRREKIGFEPPQKKWLHSNYIDDIFEDSLLKLKQKGVIKKNINIKSDIDKWPLLIAGYYI